jgi:hypothetical protein
MKQQEPTTKQEKRLWPARPIRWIMSDTPHAIRFKFTRAPGYRILSANGAWGALASNGVIAVDFYVERLASPEAIVHYMAGDKLGQEDRIPPEEAERIIEREAQVGFILSPAAARAIGRWLTEKADEHDKLASGQSDEVEEADGARG